MYCEVPDLPLGRQNIYITLGRLKNVRAETNYRRWTSNGLFLNDRLANGPDFRAERAARKTIKML